MVAYIPGVMSSSVAGRWSVIVVVGLSALLRTALRLRWTFVALCGGSLLVWGFASLVWALSPWDTLGALLHWASLVGLAVLVARLEDASGVWQALALGVLVSLPFTIAQAFGYTPVWSLTRIGMPGNVGLFLTSNVLTELAIPLAILMITQRRWWCVAGLSVPALLSGRAETFLMFGVVGAIFGWSSRGVLRRQHWLVVVILLGACLALALDDLLIVRGLSVSALESQLYNSAHDRLLIWEETLKHMTVLGYGLGSYQTAFPAFSFAHNDLLQFTFELGIGVVPLIGIIAYALLTAGHGAERLALVALLASSLIWAPTNDPATALVLCLLVGHLCGARHRARFVESLRGALAVRNAVEIGPIPARALPAAGRDIKALAPR